MDYPIVETDTYTYTVGTFTGTATVNSSTIIMTNPTGTTMTLSVSQTWSDYCRIDSLRILKALSISGTLTSITTSGMTQITQVIPATASMSGTTTYVRDDGAGWVLYGDEIDTSVISTQTEVNTFTGATVVTTPSVDIGLSFLTHINTSVEAE